MKAKRDCDDTSTEPKTGGFDKPGTGKDCDDTSTEPKTGGFEKPAG